MARQRDGVGATPQCELAQASDNAVLRNTLFLLLSPTLGRSAEPNVNIRETDRRSEKNKRQSQCFLLRLAKRR